MLRIGTTSWGEKSLIESGRFYPPAVRTPEERLAYFASRFSVTEIDTSYYGLPTAETVQRWVDATPGGFVFDIKAFRMLTMHRTPVRALPPELRSLVSALGKRDVYWHQAPETLRRGLWQRFRECLEPLHQSGKLGVVLLQFAPWFVSGAPSFAHLERCAIELRDYRVAVEMRNKSWFSARNRRNTLELEEDLGFSHVIVDEPQGFGSSVPQVWAVTTPTVAVVRLHGRNRPMWHGHRAISTSQRFDYLYSRAELEAFAEPVEQLMGRVAETHVVFNNCHRDNAQRNAAMFQDMIRGRLGLGPSEIAAQS